MSELVQLLSSDNHMKPGCKCNDCKQFSPAAIVEAELDEDIRGRCFIRERLYWEVSASRGLAHVNHLPQPSPAHFIPKTTVTSLIVGWAINHGEEGAEDNSASSRPNS